MAKWHKQHWHVATYKRNNQSDIIVSAQMYQQNNDNPFALGIQTVRIMKLSHDITKSHFIALPDILCYCSVCDFPRSVERNTFAYLLKVSRC